jgi:hypothetical protein
MVQEFTQPLTEMRYEKFFWSKAQAARKADNLTAIAKDLENVGSSTSHTLIGVRGLL